MKTVAQQSLQTSAQQTSQRVKVGMIGLAAVVLLIGLASALFSLANRDRPATIAAHTQVAANLPAAKASDAASANEPLAELGVAPTVDTNTAATVAPK